MLEVANFIVIAACQNIRAITNSQNFYYFLQEKRANIGTSSHSHILYIQIHHKNGLRKIFKIFLMYIILLYNNFKIALKF